MPTYLFSKKNLMWVVQVKMVDLRTSSENFYGVKMVKKKMQNKTRINGFRVKSTIAVFPSFFFSQRTLIHLHMGVDRWIPVQVCKADYSLSF